MEICRFTHQRYFNIVSSAFDNYLLNKDDDDDDVYSFFSRDATVARYT